MGRGEGQARGIGLIQTTMYKPGVTRTYLTTQEIIAIIW